MIESLLLAVAALFLSLHAWKHVIVVRFFRRAPPPLRQPPALVSILQPILSGDPTLTESLAQTLRFHSRYALDIIWLIDEGDAEAWRIAAELAARFPDRPVRTIAMPPPGDGENPKMVKLVAGLRAARGDVICVLDDDTRLPDDAFDLCLPWLDTPRAGLVFGLPYYVSMHNLWSRLVAYFVNSHSLLTYVPYTALNEPVTINGMFYGLRRPVLDALGGFAGLEHVLADDFAVAQRVRAGGYRLVQTPLRHAISTDVRGPRRYLSLIQRWFIFPRESLMRHLPARALLLLNGLALLPAFFPLAGLVAALLVPSGALGALVLAYLAYDWLIFAHFNRAYLAGASPWRHAWLVPLIQLLFPLQLIAALLAPQRIVWRGHVMQVERGGSFRFVRRRGG